MTRKKILFVARWYPDRHDPMLGLFVQKHAQAVQLLHDVTVLYVTSDNTLSPGKIITSRDDFHGINEIRIYFGKSAWGFMNAFRYLLNYFAGLKMCIKTSGVPDLTHVHILSRTAIPALWLKATRGIPFIITEHWSRYLPVNLEKGAYTGILRRLFTRFAVKQASAVTTVTKNLAEAMQRLGLKNRYIITPNIADTDLFRPTENRDITGRHKLIHISCFDEPAKNIRGIIDAVVELSRKRNNFYLEIIGDGADFEMVQTYAKNTGLTGTLIFFTGLLTGEELASRLRTSDALVMFSNYENLPCTIVESISSGVPVISTDVGGIREHLSPEFGILINRGNTSELITAIDKILNGYSQFEKTRARTYALENFSMTASSELFNRIYGEII